MIEVWQRKLADAEVPVGVPCPFDLEWIAVIEGQLDLLALEFVDDGAVVNAVDGNVPVAVSVVELASPLHDLPDIYHRNAKHARGECEISLGFLVPWIDFEQDDIFRIMVGDDRTMQERLVRIGIESVEVHARSAGDVVSFEIGLRERRLVRIQRRERLQFDELRMDATVVRAREAEVNLHKQWALGLVRHVPFGRDGRVRSAAVFRILNELKDEVAPGGSEFVDE